MEKEREIYDLIIIGGGVAATFLSLSIYKKNPAFKILIIEKSAKFPQKIGESIVDLPAVYLKTLHIDHILKKHTHKTGVRFLFNEANSPDISQVAEFASPTFPGRITGYHLDRRLFDQDLIDEVISKGATVYRPAEITEASFEEFNNQLTVKTQQGLKYVRARWLVDATGRARFVPRKLHWQDKKIALNTGSIMAHFQDVAPDDQWDTPQNEYWDTYAVGPRKYSTTHLMRKNSWWWIIRLDDQTTSIGVVFDKDQVKFEDHEQFFLNQLNDDAQLSAMTKDAQIGVIRHVEHVPYVCEKIFSKGIALIGESGAFLDPLISPGIELIGQQTIWLADLLTKEKKTSQFAAKAWMKYQETFHEAYDARLSIYKPAYTYMHSYDIFSAWLKQGNYMYFSRVVLPALFFKKKLKAPLRFNAIDRLALWYFRKRFHQIICKREAQQRISATRSNEISYSGVRVPNNKKVFYTPLILLAKALGAYLKLEWIELRHFLKPSSN